MSEYNESQINSNETERIAAEQQRIENEAQRQTNETEREAREATRQSNESTRIIKEAEREEEHNRKIEEIDALIDELKSGSSGSSEYAHSHTNKAVLDGITANKVTAWDNKSDFNGDYNSLINKPNIPSIEGLATESYVKNEIANAQLEGGETDLSGYATKDELNNKADKTEIPTKVSQLTNDSNFLTSIPSEYITEDELNTELSAKANITDIPSLDGYATESFVTNKIADASLSGGEASNHTHSNKDVLDTITSDMTTKWNKSTPFEDRYVSDCNAWLTNGYIKTHANNTTNLPSICTGLDKWGVLFFIAENSDEGTGIQMYFPADGTNAGRIFTRSIKSRTPREWKLLSIFDGNYDSLTNKPTEYVRRSELNALISQINALRSDVDRLLQNNGGEDGGEVLYYNPTMTIENDRAVFKENGHQEKFLITHVENKNDPNYRGSVQVRGSDGYDYFVLLTDNAESTNSKFRYNNLIPSHGGWRSDQNKAGAEYPFVPDRTYPYRNNFNFTDTVENVDNSVNSDLLNKVLEHFNNFFPAVNMQVATSSKNKVRQQSVSDGWWGAHYPYGSYFEIIINETPIRNYAGAYGAGKYEYSDRGCWIHTVLHEFSHCLGLKDQPKHEPSLFNYDAPYSQLAGELFLQPNDFCALNYFYKKHYNLDITPETTQADVNNQLAQNVQVATFANELYDSEIEDDEVFMDFSYPTFNTTDMKVEVSDVVVKCKLKFDKEEKIQIAKDGLSLKYNIFTIEPLETFKGELVNNKLKIHISENINIDENAEYLAYLVNFEDVPCSLINPTQGLEKLSQ